MNSKLKYYKTSPPTKTLRLDHDENGHVIGYSFTVDNHIEMWEDYPE